MKKPHQPRNKRVTPQTLANGTHRTIATVRAFGRMSFAFVDIGGDAVALATIRTEDDGSINVLGAVRFPRSRLNELDHAIVETRRQLGTG